MTATAPLALLLAAWLEAGTARPAAPAPLADEPVGTRARILLVAGGGPGALHDHAAGLRHLAETLASVPGLSPVLTEARPGRPPPRLRGARAVVLYADGGVRHPLADRAFEQALDAFAARGGGLVFVHAALVAGGALGHKLRRWMGGSFEPGATSGPPSIWAAGYERLPSHPTLRGVRPFTLDDEWLLGARFGEGADAPARLLGAIPPEVARRKPLPAEEATAWAHERPGGGRSFAISGGHYADNWRHEAFRRLLANAVLWTARIEVPGGGAPSPSPTTLTRR